MKRVIIVPGWAATEGRHFFPYLTVQLNNSGYNAKTLRMPSLFRPVLSEWISFLNKEIGEVDSNTIIVAHSIGCKAVLHYLEQLPKGNKCRAFIAVAPLVLPRFTPLFPTFYENNVEPEKVVSHAQEIIVLHDHQDRLAPFVNAKFMKEYFGAKLIECAGMKHFNDFEGITKPDDVFEAITDLDNPPSA